MQLALSARVAAYLALTASLASLVSGATLFEGATLIVDARQPAVENGAILIDHGNIVKVGRRGEIKLPTGAIRVDLTGKTVIPAMVDAHVHLGYQKGLSYAAENFTRENLVAQLNLYAYCGVAAVLSLGTDLGDLPFQIRADQEAGRLGGALYRTAGKGFGAANGGGPGTPALKGSAYEVTDEAQAREWVRKEIARKADIIKIWVDDRGGTVPKLTPPLYAAIIDEAHKHGSRVIAHVYYLEDAKRLLRAGIDAFAHMVRDKEWDDETIALMKQRNIAVMPNMGIAATRAEPTTPAWLDDPLLRETADPAVIERVRESFAKRSPEAMQTAQKTYRIMEHNLARLNREGIRIVFGGDAGAVPDHFYAYSAHRELRLMVAAGMTPAQALSTITVNSSEFLRLPDHGTLDAGKAADFVILNANPLDNIANTMQIADVYLRGEKLNRATLLPSKASAKN